MATKKKQTLADPPRFLVQHTKDDIFIFCVEINGAFQCWASAYPPSMDTRFKRGIKKVANQPISAYDKESSTVKIWDKGTYSLSGAKTKAEAEKAFLRGLADNKLSFSLEGEQLKGRFAIHYEDNTDSLLLYKYKDKFAHEEDPLEMELQRSMNKWVPRFDPDKISLETKPKKEKSKPAEKPKKEPKQKKNAPPAVEEEPVVEEEELMDEAEAASEESLRATIKGKDYSFGFYRSIGGEEDDIICLITPVDGAPFVMRRGEKRKWEIISSVSIDIARQEAEFRKAITRFSKELEL